MKTVLLAAFAIGLTMTAAAQTDSTAPDKADTLKVGNITIIKKHDPNDTTTKNDVWISRGGKKSKKNPNVSTNWWIVDLGFANYSDNTNYAQTTAAGATSADINEQTMELRAGKSINVNIWMFMQKVNLIKHV